jgi:hypothetical protein
MPSTTASRFPYRRRARRMNSSGVNGSSMVHLYGDVRIYGPIGRTANLQSLTADRSSPTLIADRWQLSAHH